MLLREHLQEQHREGSIIAEGNQCQRNRGCKAANCASSRAGTRRGGRGAGGIGAEETAVGSQGSRGILGTHLRGTGMELVDGKDSHRLAENGGSSLEAGGGGEDKRLIGAAGDGGAKSVMWNGAGQICIPTAEEEGLPLPAAMTLRFLAAMDEGYVGSMREENARSRKRKDGAG